jgi:hypothetical protein
VGFSARNSKDLLGLVRTEVIGNDVDLTLGGLTVDDVCQEIDKLLTGMPCGGFG